MQQPIFQVDIGKINFDFSLCKEEEKSFYYRFCIIPWQRLNNTVFFIVEDINQDIVNWVKFNYGDNYILVKVDNDQVLNLLNSHFSVAEFASNYLYHKNSSFSAKGITFGSIACASFITMISALTLIEKYTYFVLILIFIIGCSSSLFKFITTIFGLYNKKTDQCYSGKDFPIYIHYFTASFQRKCSNTTVD